MGRRSLHTPEELRELILVSTRKVVEEEGIAQPSAREIARAIGYAPGTLYNMFTNLGDILLHVEARVFAELDERLARGLKAGSPRDQVTAFVGGYVDFAFDKKRLWALICQHNPEQKAASPAWYLEAVNAPLVRLQDVLMKALPSLDREGALELARQIWVSIHGVVLVGMTSKFGELPRNAVLRMAHEIVEATIAGRTIVAEAPIGQRRMGSRGHSASPAE